MEKFQKIHSLNYVRRGIRVILPGLSGGGGISVGGGFPGNPCSPFSPCSPCSPWSPLSPFSPLRVAPGVGCET